MDIQSRINELSVQLKELNRLYYNDDISRISDFEYDRLFHELVELESKYPLFKQADSPTNSVGVKVSNGFKSLAHSTSMLSLGNAFTQEDVYGFLARTSSKSDESFVVEWKFDGLAVNLTYIDGALTSAGTRGDGLVGEDLTSNALMIETIPRQLISLKQIPSLIEIRGEVIIDKIAFDQLNQRNPNKPFSNMRNAAAGSFRQLNPEITRERNLTFIPYALGNGLSYIDNCIENQEDVLKWFKQVGFYVPDFISAKRSTLETDLAALLSEFQQKRKELPFMTDGLVFKLNNLNLQAGLGATARCPKGAIAYKFPAQEKTAKVLSVDFQVGRSGIITPVVNIEPVNLGGVMIKRATIYNFNKIQDLQLGIGSLVTIRRAGDVIPEIIDCKLLEDSIAIERPTTCPSCQHGLTQKGVGLYCVNEHCESKLTRKIIHFFSKPAIFIDGLGDVFIEALVNVGSVKHAVDVFKLDYLTVSKCFKLNNIPFSDIVLRSLLGKIQQAKQCHLDRLLVALGIEGVHEVIARNLIKHFNNFKAISVAGVDSLVLVPKVGKTTAIKIHAFFRDPLNQRKIAEMFEAGVVITDDGDSIPDTTKQKTFVITGVFDGYTRETIASLIKSRGFNVSKVVIKDSILIVGKNPGSKLDVAKRLGNQIITLDSFIHTAVF